MAFESLSEKFQRIIKKIKGQSHLTKQNMDEMLKEIRIALLEADVNFKVAKSFLTRVEEKAIGTEVYTKVNPSEMLVKIVHDELVKLLGSEDTNINYEKNKPTIIMLVGLQGSGKTTTAAKLALLMQKKLNKKVLLSSVDIYRPGAYDQLATLAKQINIPILANLANEKPLSIAKRAKEKAYNEHFDVLILDTAGRLHIDSALMQELNDLKALINPTEILLLVDAMSGQDAINVANTFHHSLTLTGVIMSKLDGDARGGAALSIKELTSLPIKFAGVGEKITDLDIFHPDRMADRILGMGDIVTLVEKVQEEIDEKEARKMANKLSEGEFTLEDMLVNMKKMQKMGPLAGLLKMIPGMPSISQEQQNYASKEMNNFEIIFNSMTPYERRHPECLKNSRKVRIARGSGKTSADINRMLKKYDQMRQMMKMMKGYNKKGGMLPPGGFNNLF